MRRRLEPGGDGKPGTVAHFRDERGDTQFFDLGDEDYLEMPLSGGAAPEYIIKKDLVKEKESKQNSGNVSARDLEIVRLSREFNKAAEIYCPTGDSLVKFLADFLNSVASKSSVLPSKAPELYEDRENRQENAPDFIIRVYKSWLDKGLSQPDIRRLNPKLYTALHNWLRKNSMPPELKLPTKSEALAQEVQSLNPQALREARRIAKAVYRQKQQIY